MDFVAFDKAVNAAEEIVEMISWLIKENRAAMRWIARYTIKMGEELVNGRTAEGVRSWGLE